MPEPQFVNGIGDFADRYAGFIIDQWGVLHDGARPLPGALEVIAELKRRNKRIVLLSNSGRRAAFNRGRLTAMGFNLADYETVVTSGEAAWLALRDRRVPGFAEIGRRCYLLTHYGDMTVVDDLDVELVDDLGRADFIFATGLDIPPKTLDDYRWLAEAAAARDLPMVCSNPDKVAVSQDTMVTAPGALAALYEELGGKVLYVGKPHRPIYQACLDALPDLRLDQLVAIGDSVEHDIKGANGIGIASCFLMGGIHMAGFPPDAPRSTHEHHLEQLCRRYGACPDWVAPRMVW